jgi:hypothetical protein
MVFQKMECPPLQAFRFSECPQVSYTCQALLNKAPIKGGKEEERERTEVQAQNAKIKSASQWG